MRVGIIGGGFGLKVQAPIIQAHPDLEVVAVSTMTRHVIPEEMSSWERIPVHYTDWKNMLEHEQLELLFVSALPVYHFEMVKYAIYKGIHVVCEKPFTMNSNESAALLRLTEQYNAKVVVDFEWRFHPLRQKVQELVRNREIGRLLHFEYHISSAQYQRLRSTAIGWMGKRQCFGGMLGALGTHMMDCLLWIAGQDEIETLNGLIHTHVPEGASEVRDAEDAFLIHGRMKDSFTFSIQLLSGIHHGFGSQLRLFGSAGTIQLTDDRVLCLGKENGLLEELHLPKSDPIPALLSMEARAYYPAFYPFVEKVYVYVAEDRLDPDLPTVLDGHKNQKIIDRILNPAGVGDCL